MKFLGLNSFGRVLETGPTLLEQLGESLIESGRLSRSSLARAREVASASYDRFDKVLSKLGLCSDADLAAAWSEITGYEVLAPNQLPAEPIVVESLKPQFLLFAQVLPVAISDMGLAVAISDPLNSETLKAIAVRTGRTVSASLLPAGVLANILDRSYGEEPNRADDQPSSTPRTFESDVERLRDLAENAPVIKFVNEIFDHAIEAKASDIHLTATQKGTLVRFRLDGVLRERETLSADLLPAVISRLKILAGLDIAERRVPQDGRIRFVWQGREIDLRLATTPHVHGEGAVIRILDRTSVASLTLETLGFTAQNIRSLRKALSAPHGIVLATGPTGSGKTTTLYAALSEMRRPDRNIVTVEDPVEYSIEGINQIAVNKKVGLDFSTALRSVLRQDPDVIMVGEIRDSETAAVAVQAALTGHLVLASLHTNNASAAAERLIDMGVEPFLLASTLRAALAQRLVRRICRTCGGQDMPESSLACKECRGSGYSGRQAIVEFLEINQDIASMISSRAGAQAIETAATLTGMSTLRESGLQAVSQGETTLAEVLRVTGEAG